MPLKVEKQKLRNSLKTRKGKSEKVDSRIKSYKPKEGFNKAFIINYF